MYIPLNLGHLLSLLITYFFIRLKEVPIASPPKGFGTYLRILLFLFPKSFSQINYDIYF